MVEQKSDKSAASWVPSGLKVRAAQAPQPSSQPISPKVTHAPETGAQSQADTRAPLISPAETHAARTPPPPTAKGPGFEPMPILTLVTLLCLGILTLLGFWQWEKFVEKSKAPPEQIAAPIGIATALELSDPEYRAVIVDGIMDPRTIKVIAVQDAVRGYRLFSPVLLEAGGIFVDRGFVAEENLSRVAPLSGQVSIQGVLRSGARANAYTPDNEPTGDVWYWPDLRTMADTMMIQATSEQFYVAQAQVDPLSTGTAIINPYADRKGANKIPPERHLGYAATWWGFGIALIGVYMGMHVRAGRLRFVRQR